MIGKTILHYKILEKLGEGGMGIVYKAKDSKLDRTVAIKFLPSDIASDSEERKRFTLEAKAAAVLNHPNIATIHAIGEADDQTFIVMECIHGKELKEKISEGLLDFKDIFEITRQITTGLEDFQIESLLKRLELLTEGQTVQITSTVEQDHRAYVLAIGHGLANRIKRCDSDSAADQYVTHCLQSIDREDPMWAV